MSCMRFMVRADITSGAGDDWFDLVLTGDTPMYVDPSLVFEDESPLFARARRAGYHWFARRDANRAACRRGRRASLETGIDVVLLRPHIDRCEQTSHPASTLSAVEYFTGSYARSTPVRPVTDVDVVVIAGDPGVGKSRILAEVAERLTTKLEKYYDKTTGTVVDGVPDLPGSRPDTFKIAVQAIKRHRLGTVVVQGPRSLAVTFPEGFGSIDVLPALDAAADGRIICCEDSESALHPNLPTQVPPPEPPDPGQIEREQVRRERDLERRARILLRRMLRVVRVRRVRTTTVASVDGVDHSTESHRSRAPGRKTWSSPAFRALAAA